MDFVPSYSYYSYYYIICMQTHSKDWICCKHELEPLNLFWSRSGIGLGLPCPGPYVGSVRSTFFLEDRQVIKFIASVGIFVCFEIPIPLHSLHSTSHKCYL